MGLIEPLLEKHGFVGRHEGQCGFHMGSTSIKGLMGKHSIDMSFVTQGLLPSFDEAFIRDIEAHGYIYGGPAPHMMNKYQDQWCHKHTDSETKAETGVDHFSAHFVAKNSIPSLLKYT